ncbi:MAG TPA: Wzz/FepE/Etk N-terminal domain-containing protein [Gaiellaceae bacterium]|jgi:Mrp family chromosome partitioning ATPase|nr:Wzz/FepE/Etk N-terminal domain-containing protein [Gaiellaceae bacterium]
MRLSDVTREPADRAAAWPTAEPPEQTSALQQYLRTLRRRKWIVLQALILTPLAAAFLSLRQQPQYQATASVLLGDETVAAVLAGAADSASADRIAQTQADIARTPQVLRNAIAPVRGAENVTVDDLLKRSSVSPRTNSDVLDFRVKDESASRAEALATSYANQFVAFRSRLTLNALERARTQVERRLDELRARGAGAATLAPLVKREHDLLSAEASTGSQPLVLRRATDADRVQPHPVRNIVLGVMLGLALGIGLAALWDALDTRVRSVAEIRDLLTLPLLGRVRAPSRRGAGELVMQTDPYGREAEAFRILRANLDFANVDRSARVIMLTGAVDGEGRSTTVANLAVACALAGRKVVLADLDLRHPSIGRFFALDGRPGLTDVALGHVDLEDALAPVALRGRPESDLGTPLERPLDPRGSLEVLPAGPAPLDSGEFVGSRAVQDVLQALEQRADLVLVDAPPLLPVGDARTLSATVHALVLVTNLEFANRPMLEELRRVLDACPTRVLGFVATGVDETQDDHYGGFYEHRTGRYPRAKERAA